MLLADVAETLHRLVTTVFSSTIAVKAWFATAAAALALVQLTTAARIYGRLQLPARARSGDRACPPLVGADRVPVHAAVFFHCVTILGFQTPDARVAIHSLLGTFLYGVFVAKVLVVRDHSLPGWALPTAGLTLASMLLAALADVEPLVLHDGQVRLLMGRGWRPVAGRRCGRRGDVRPRQGQVFAPSAPAAGTPTGDVASGETVFARELRRLSR